MASLLVLAWILYMTEFFFQAEDCIRDGHVTGVQTCALPILVTMGLRLLLERALPRFGAGSRPMLGIYAVHVVLVAASVVLNPLACIYAFVEIGRAHV